MSILLLPCFFTTKCPFYRQIQQPPSDNMLAIGRMYCLLKEIFIYTLMFVYECGLRVSPQELRIPFLPQTPLRLLRGLWDLRAGEERQLATSSFSTGPLLGTFLTGPLLLFSPLGGLGSHLPRP